MMKFAHFVSLFLVCVLMVHAVDGRKHHRHMKRGKERMRPEKGAREIVPKLVRNTNKATDAVLDVVKNDNKATAENKVLPLIKQDTAITASDVQVEAEELPVQTKHRRGRKGRERFAFRKKDEGFHKHKRGFHKRHRGHRKRGHPKINEENLNIKNLGKLIKRAKHMGRKQNREQLKKDNTH